MKIDDEISAVIAALNGEIPPTHAMVSFLEEAAKDAEDYGDFNLARENRDEADELRRILLERDDSVKKEPR